MVKLYKFSITSHIPVTSYAEIFYCNYFRRAQELRRQRASTVIQKHVRGWLARLKYSRIKKSVLLIQTYGRGLLARRLFMKMKYNAAVS